MPDARCHLHRPLLTFFEAIPLSLPYKNLFRFSLPESLPLLTLIHHLLALIVVPVAIDELVVFVIANALIGPNNLERLMKAIDLYWLIGHSLSCLRFNSLKCLLYISSSIKQSISLD